MGRSKIEFTDAALDAIIEGYTREAGVRSLEREIGSVCRKVAREFAEGTRRSKRMIRPEIVTRAARQAALPAETCSAARASRAWPPAWRGRRSAATCCSWRPPPSPATGKLQITGQLGDVMKESAAAALSYVKSAADDVNGDCPRDWFQEPRPPRARARRGDPEGRAERGHHDGHRDRLAHHRPAGARRHRDDGRDHAHRPGAADRRPEGEGARRAARRHPPADRAEAQRGRTSTTCPSTCASA